MRWTLISFVFAAFIGSAFGQADLSENVYVSKSPINIGLEEVNKTFVPHALTSSNLKSGTSKECNMNVTFVNFPDDAKRAFAYAVSIWEQHIASPITVNIVARWESREGNIIADGCPSAFHKNFNEAPYTNVYYPVALAEKLTGRDLNGSKEADIVCNFNNLKPWYFGTDGNTPETSYDLVYVALHEIAHGLGISGFFEDSNNEGLCNNPSHTPSAYDFFVFNSQKQRIADKSIFQSPSAELHRELTSNNLNFSYSVNNNETEKAGIYAPGTWNPGGSIYHLKEANISMGDQNELMTPFTYKGEAIHNPGEKTLHILSEIGWNTEAFKLMEITDIEETCEKLHVQTSIITGSNINNSKLKIFFSKDYFQSKDSLLLSFNNSSNTFEGELPIEFHKGKIQYYFSAFTNDNKYLTYPNHAPSNILNFKIGTDYYPPLLKHNPTKMISRTNPEMDFTAYATDNLGIQSVKIEYKINGIIQEPFHLTALSNDIFKGNLKFPATLNNNDIVEYRVLAEDNSIRKNKKYLPTDGYFEVQIFDTFKPITGYFSDFNSYSSDFIINDFDIDIPAGFSNGTLHTMNPYPQSEINAEKYNITAQLRYPIILEEYGQMTFDEIVLVEPGEHGTRFTDDIFWDYVIVEASKNNGKSWEPLVEGYDSGINESWEMQFSNSLKSNLSDASGHENMFWKHTINLTDNVTFYAGDTVLIRFRLASDNSVNGWGWAIDNLKIQSVVTGNKEILASENVNVYPNPFTNNVFIECTNIKEQSAVEVLITDLTGKTVYRETNYDVGFSPKLKLDLSGIQSGIYLASITDENFNTVTKRIIKN